MGQKVLLTALCWLSLHAKGFEQKVVNSSLVKNNDSAESATEQKFMNSYEPFRIYASGVPYGTLRLQDQAKTFAFNSPVALEPMNSGSHLVPIKEESYVIRTQNGVLKDSYGNKFIGSPQTVAYKTMFPQQFVRLQDLPLHLSQPLVAYPGYGFNGQQYGSIRSSGTTPPLIRYNSPHSQMYAGYVRSVTPVFGRYSVPNSPQQQPSNSKAVYTNKHPQEKIQRLEGKPQVNYNEASVQKPQPAKQVTVTTVNNNGKINTFTLATKPPLPLINLSLLQPLTFSNPIVPQVQHFLPKITYDIPKVESHIHHDEFVVQKTKSYDTGIIPDHPENKESDEETDEQDTPKPSKEPAQQGKSQNHHEHDEKPSLTVEGNRGGPEYSFKINSPNYMEHYNEKSVDYDKTTDYKPVQYTYSEHIEKKPVSYSYTTSSKEPVKSVHYETHNQGPGQMIQNLKPEGDGPSESSSSQSAENESGESEESGEGSKEHFKDQRDEHHSSSYPPRPSTKDTMFIDKRKPPLDHIYHHEGSPKVSHQLKPEHRDGDLNSRPNYNVYNNPNNIVYGKPRQHNSQQIRVPVHIPIVQSINPHQYEETLRFVPVQQQNSPIQVNNHQQQPQIRLIHNFNDQGHHQQPEIQNHPSINRPENHHPQGLNPDSQHHQHEFVPTHPPQHNQYHHGSSNSPQLHHQFKPSTQLHLHHKISPQRPPQQVNHAPFHSHPQHHHGSPQDHQNHETSTQNQSHNQEETSQPQQHKPHSQPHIVEKSRKIIIQEETPDEMHSHREQMVAEMINQENKSEEDFDKSYKEAAYGFPSYNRDPHQIEKDIYDPDSYGAPKLEEYNIDDSPFKQFQEDGDEFPKRSRLTYKDHINNMKEDYYLDYSLAQPESLLDRHKNKINYYKMYKKQKPTYYFADDPKKKLKMTEKYTVDPFGFQQKSQDYFAAYKASPKYEYDYSKEAPRDSSAFPSAISKERSTLFVEPQFQYGFEPISLPTLGGELSAMATNDSPEKAGTRKKIYQENWYIKKTSSGDESSS